jgi:hypothetical protein
MKTKGNNPKENQWFWQIILPFIICLLFLSIGSILLTLKVPVDVLNMRMVADISSSFLIFLSFPLMLITFSEIILIIVLVQKVITHNRSAFPKLQSIFKRVNDGAIRICEASMRPFFLIEPILSLFERNKIQGHKHGIRK